MNKGINEYSEVDSIHGSCPNEPEQELHTCLVEEASLLLSAAPKGYNYQSNPSD